MRHLQVSVTIISQMFILLQFQQYEDNIYLEKAAAQNVSDQIYFS